LSDAQKNLYKNCKEQKGLHRRQHSHSLSANLSIVKITVLVPVVFPQTFPAKLVLANRTLHVHASTVLLDQVAAV
jgi:hypothetical protein